VYISIFGLGYVGCVSLGCLAQNGHNVIGIDVNPIKVDQINSGKPTIIENGISEIVAEQYKLGRISATLENYKKAVLSTEISIITVGTPSSKNGHLKLNYVFKVAGQIAEALREKNTFHTIIVRSTVTPGTCAKLVELFEQKSKKKQGSDFIVVINPEFMREGTAVFDYHHPPFILIGCDKKDIASDIAHKLYENISAEIITTDVKVAEIIKYVNNSYHALKICFANEIGNVCSALGIDSNTVMEIFTKDTKLNISPNYFKPGFAYGGSCLPKDVKGLKTIAHDLYLKTPIIDNIQKSNGMQIQRAIDIITKFKKKKLGFLGLSFKAGTDDFRNSPAVAVVENLIGKGYEIKIFDKNINLSRISGTNKDYIETHIPHLARLLSPNPYEVINTSEIIIVATKETDFNVFLADICNKVIIDFVGLEEMVTKKENYLGINW